MRLIRTDLREDEVRPRLGRSDRRRCSARCRRGSAPRASCACPGPSSKQGHGGKGPAGAWPGATTWPEDLAHIEGRGCLPGADPDAVSARAPVNGGRTSSGRWAPATTTWRSRWWEPGRHPRRARGSRARRERPRADPRHAPLRLARIRASGRHRLSQGSSTGRCPTYGISVRDREYGVRAFPVEGGSGLLRRHDRRGQHRVRQSPGDHPPDPGGLLQGPSGATRARWGSAWSTTSATTLPSSSATRWTAGKWVLVVHRKGAARAFGPGEPDVPADYREIGQPVIIGGSMETGSALLVGTTQAMAETWGSTAHGAGRTMSRAQAKRQVRGETLLKDMAERGIIVRAASKSGVAEEAGFAYKDLTAVVDTLHRLDISRRGVRSRRSGTSRAQRLARRARPAGAAAQSVRCGPGQGGVFACARRAEPRGICLAISSVRRARSKGEHHEAAHRGHTRIRNHRARDPGGRPIRRPVPAGADPGESRAQERSASLKKAPQVAKGQEIQAPRSPKASARAQDIQAPRSQDIQSPRGQDIQSPRGQDIQSPRGQDIQSPPSQQEIPVPRGQEIQAPRVKQAGGLVQESEAACKKGDMALSTRKAKEALGLLKK